MMQTCKAWVNGEIIDEAKVVVPANLIGFQYGAGLFETIRVDKGIVLRLKEHLKRISSSWQTLFNEEIPHINQITWENVIGNLIHLNQLIEKTAAVKLIVAQPDFVAVFARPYQHRLEIKRHIIVDKIKSDATRLNGGLNLDGLNLDGLNLDGLNLEGLNLEGLNLEGLDLITFSEKRHSPLAAHKSLNYLYYHLAAQFAKKHQCDEAIICNADGTVSETNTGSLISVSLIDHKVIIPKSDYSLPSITLNAALELFSKAGYKIDKRKIIISELILMKNIMVLNALMGAVKVLSIDGQKIFHSSDFHSSNFHSSDFHNSNSDISNNLCSWLNNGLFCS